MSNNTDLEKQLARLDTQVDFLQTELLYLNEILIRYGFEGGIGSIKKAVENVLHELEE